MRRIRVLVRGEVQGVGYRAFTRRCAAILGLGGWVRNNLDGTVETELIGTYEALEEMTNRLREGPRWSRVDEVEITLTEDIPDNLQDSIPTDFQIR